MQEVNSTLNIPASSIKTADLNLDHDIAGEFEAAIDPLNLESRKKYDFMNLDGPVKILNNEQSPFTADHQSAIRPAANLRNTGSIMGDFDDRSSSFNVSAPHYN